MRYAEIVRETAETQIRLELELDGTGKGSIDTGIGFLDHMLTLFAYHGQFDLTVHCKGDTQVDDHHSTEDIGICLGEAFKQALGDKRGITRYGDTTLPMDEALILSAVDISGRGGCFCTLDIPTEKVGFFDTQLVEEFWEAFARSSTVTVHLHQWAGKNTHHILEAVFKSLGHTLHKAVAIQAGEDGRVPSTKGTL